MSGEKEFRERIPMECYGKTEKIAEVIAFLASDSAGYITGQNIRVDGGLTRSIQANGLRPTTGPFPKSWLEF